MLRGASAAGSWGRPRCTLPSSRRGGGAGRGLRRPAARGRRHRAADGAARRAARRWRHRRSRWRCRRRRRRGALRGGAFPPIHRGRQRRSTTGHRWSSPGETVALVGPAAPARPPCSSCCCASTIRSRGASSWMADLRSCAAGPARAHRPRAAGAGDLLGQRWRTSATGGRTASDDEVRAAARGARRRASSARCPKATTPSWASAACGCRAGSGSASRSRGRC